MMNKLFLLVILFTTPAWSFAQESEDSEEIAPSLAEIARR
jgi:hypothetical protein